MTKTADAPATVLFVEDSSAPEIFVAEAFGFAGFERNIHITFAAPRVRHSTNPPSIERRVVARIVIPITGAQGLVSGLSDFLKQRGIDLSAPAGPPTPTGISTH
jgi:hypothetical protein